MGPKELQDVYEGARKKGQAILHVIFRGAPDDETFMEDDPLANVTVIMKDRTTGAEVARESCQMSAKMEDHPFRFQLLSIVKVLKRAGRRLKGKPKPLPYDVSIVVEPHADWQDRYSQRSS